MVRGWFRGYPTHHMHHPHAELPSSMPGASWSGCCFNHIGGKTRRNESMSMAWWKRGMTGNAWKRWFLTINIWMSYRLPLIRWWNEPSEFAGRNRFCTAMHNCCRPMLQRAQQKGAKLWKVSTVSTSCHLSGEGADKSWIFWVHKILDIRWESPLRLPSGLSPSPQGSPSYI
jgi:hypothetical protein